MLLLVLTQTYWFYYFITHFYRQLIASSVAKGGRTFFVREAGGLLSRIREAGGNFQKQYNRGRTQGLRLPPPLWCYALPLTSLTNISPTKITTFLNHWKNASLMRFLQVSSRLPYSKQQTSRLPYAKTVSLPPPLATVPPLVLFMNFFPIFAQVPPPRRGELLALSHKLPGVIHNAKVV